MTKSLMIMGTASHVGKSIIATALCRIAKQDGYRVAPFKSQNMSLNAAVTVTGCEIGRAQAVQAQACGIVANEHMNPVLLKPMKNQSSQVIVQGRMDLTVSARHYFTDLKADLWQAVCESYRYLADRYNLIIIEGAGSPVEMNLKATEIANMKTAEMANASILLVADIDRGGVFASVVGTLTLMTEEERARVKGIIINKFRGDPTLFDEGVTWLEQYTKIPVLGVVPYLHDIEIEEEDSLGLFTTEKYHRDRSLAARSTDVYRELQVAIIYLPHMANFTDFDPLFVEASLRIVFTHDPESIIHADLILLPGSKNTIADQLWLQDHGLDDTIHNAWQQGAIVFGLCGGFQMLGEMIHDPFHTESDVTFVHGLGLLPIETELLKEKTTQFAQGTISIFNKSIAVAGYEIHLGVTKPTEGYLPLTQICREGTQEFITDGAIDPTHTVFGTYLHGIFDSSDFRQHLIASVRAHHHLSPVRAADFSMENHREVHIDQLAHRIRQHVAIQPIYAMLESM